MSLTAALIIIHGNISIFFMFLGAFIGSILLFKPELNLQLTILSALVVGGSVQYFFPTYSNIRWGIVLLSLLLGVRTLLEIVVPSSNQVRVNTNGVIFCLTGFGIICILSAAMNHTPFREVAIVAKNYFQFWPITFSLLLLPLNLDTSRKVFRLLFIIASIQIPVALVQRTVFASIKGIIGGFIGILSGDIVTGTFGGSMQGTGGSGFLSIYLMFSIGSSLAFARYGQLNWKRSILTAIFFLIPTIINSTMITFILLIIVPLIVFRPLLIRRVRLTIGILIILSLVITGMGYLYIKQFSYRFDDESEYIHAQIRRGRGFFKNQGHGFFKLNRRTAISFWAEQQELSNLPQIIIGYGLGAANEGIGGIGATGQIASQFPMYGVGLSLASRLLWDVGFLGFLFYIGVLACAFRLAKKLEGSPVLEPYEKAMALCLQVGVILLFIEMIYNVNYLTIQASNIFQMLIIGLILFLSRIKTIREKNIAGDS